MESLTIEQALEDKKRSPFLNGLCFELADKLHQVYGYRFGAVWLDEPDYLEGLFPEEESLMSSITHVFVVDGVGNALDACGLRPLSSFVEDWHGQPSASGTYRVEIPINRRDVAAELGEPEASVDLSEVLEILRDPTPTLEGFEPHSLSLQKNGPNTSKLVIWTMMNAWITQRQP